MAPAQGRGVKRLVLIALLLLPAFVLPAAERADSCVHYERNTLRFPSGRAPMDAFYSKLDSVILFGRGSVNVWHVGGSHVQADIFPHRMRTRLATLQEGLSGVRGVLFPLSLAGTNFNRNYVCDCSGAWSLSSNLHPEGDLEMGITGRAARTGDASATLAVSLNNGDSFRWNFSRLLVLGYASCEDAYPYVREGENVFRGEACGAGYMIDFGSSRDGALVSFNLPEGASFTLTGVIPVNDSPAGINYYSSGVNGASVRSWLGCSRLGDELAAVSPDLAVFAIGVNDAAVPCGRFNVDAFKNGYRRIASMLRDINPGCAFIFVTNNDIYKFGGPNPNTALVQDAFYELAGELDACVWDVYDIMGGLGSIARWNDAGLAQYDLIHFTREGYELLGDLLFDALAKDYFRR